MTFLGNVVFQGTTQQNGGQIIAVYNDAGDPGLTLNVTLAYNTFIGPAGGHAALVHLSNADGTPMSAELDDNLIVGAGAAVNVEDSSAGHVSGTHNWMTTGTVATGLTGTVFGLNPMFKDAANEDFTLAATSTAIGAASETIGPTLIPVEEYYRNETIARMTRARASAHDIGAFESTTVGGGTGPRRCRRRRRFAGQRRGQGDRRHRRLEDRRHGRRGQRHRRPGGQRRNGRHADGRQRRHPRRRHRHRRSRHGRGGNAGRRRRRRRRRRPGDWRHGRQRQRLLLRRGGRRAGRRPSPCS